MSKKVLEQKVLGDLSCIETYIAEHGQETGTVSWRMALESIKRIRGLIEKAMAHIQAEAIDEVS